MPQTRNAVETAPETTSLRTLLTVAQFCERHPFATEGSIRALIFHGPENGFDKVVRRINRRVLIDEAAFFVWLDARNSEGAR